MRKRLFVDTVLQVRFSVESCNFEEIDIGGLGLMKVLLKQDPILPGLH